MRRTETPDCLFNRIWSARSPSLTTTCLHRRLHQPTLEFVGVEVIYQHRILVERVHRGDTRRTAVTETFHLDSPKIVVWWHSSSCR